ncbi:urease accessory protein UreD [Thiomicrorhabdus heinhorstiae]|uniref:Urease accessory protein UreD n=1 Tax=Thiomicrorhabdus heinhorstiae TaxID=2748010 RepID=A0ABS0C0V3_9GAMM|nr:urease accessory protein UreD [Thiomicrorhabdus heinhorstiae]MBF6058889.1 urease accessory protein UreD [Thiomicrorhabdus heinhorstiae]
MINTSLKSGWKGFLSFTLVHQWNKTVVKDKQHFGPLVLQRPYYQEPDRPTILVIHPPGGLVSGDQLMIKVTMQPGSKGLISTPAATKFYRSLGKTTTQTQSVEVSENCDLEWLPQETLFFDRVNAENTLVFNLQSADCRLIAWDIVGLGRPAMQENFRQGFLTQSLTINLSGSPIFIDRFCLSGEDELLDSAFALGGATLMATMLFYHPDVKVLQQLKERLLNKSWAGLCGITLLENVLVLRTLDCDLEEIKARLIEAWQTARLSVIGVEPVYPRIWRT